MDTVYLGAHERKINLEIEVICSEMEKAKTVFIVAAQDYMLGFNKKIILQTIEENPIDIRKIDGKKLLELREEIDYLLEDLPDLTVAVLQNVSFWCHHERPPSEDALSSEFPFINHYKLEDAIREITGYAGELLRKYHLGQTGLWELCHSRDSRPVYRFHLNWTPDMHRALADYRFFHEQWVRSYKKA